MGVTNLSGRTFKIYSLTILFSFGIFLSFIPWEYVDFRSQILLLILAMVPPLAVASYLVTNKVKSFWVSSLFLLVGLFFLYRGFYFRNPFSLLDYFLIDKEDLVIHEENRTIYRTPLSFIRIESVLIYCIVSLSGIVVGYFASFKK